MTADSKSFLFDLLATPSPTGFEAPGQRKWAAYAGQFADRVESDAYGSAWATLEAKTPADRQGKKATRVMFEAHADEICYMVKHISPDGFISVGNVGRIDAAIARGRRVDILGDKGGVRGVVGSIPIHLRDNLDDEKAPKVHDLWLDIGADSAAEVAEAGIRPGHPAIYSDGAEEFGRQRVIGRALDNRMGGFIIAEVMARLSRRTAPLPCTVIALNAVQEEIGGNGAKMAAHRLQPDVAIVLDVTYATDTPGLDHRKSGEMKLGGGPTLTHGGGNHVEVVNRLIALAAANQIPLQHEASGAITGTDTDVIFTSQGGIPSALVSLPLRYLHSVVEMADLRDVENVIRLLTAFAESVAGETEFKVRL